MYSSVLSVIPMVEYSVEIVYDSSRLDNMNTGNMSMFICIVVFYQ